MKNKLKWVINLSTLVLCVCALAIGVYAAKQASLTANGQVGFTAHNCTVEVTGSIDAYQINGENKLSGTNAQLAKTEVPKVTSVSFPAPMYFSDLDKTKGDTITITLNVKNTSAFTITATVLNPTTTIATSVAKVQGSVDVNSKQITSGADTNFVVTFKLINMSEVEEITTAATNFSIQMEFMRYNALKRTLLQRATTAESGGLDVGSVYVEMGTYNNKPLKWYAFAKDDASGNMVAFNLVNEINATTVPAGSYYFISQYALDKTVFNPQDTIYQPGVEYKNSVLQNTTLGLLNNTTYNVKGNSNILSSIVLRDLASESYTYYDVNNATSTKTTSVTNGQLFWSLSSKSPTTSEYELLRAHGTSISDRNAREANERNWWTRSPYEYFEYSKLSRAYFVDLDGNAPTDGTHLSSAYFRPAFKLVVA